jgi:hypothetical protein
MVWCHVTPLEKNIAAELHGINIAGVI